MSTDKNGKEKKPITRMTVAQFNAKKSTFAGSAVDEEIRWNKTRSCIHHETVLLDETGKASSPQIGIPAMRTNHILRKRDETSDRVSLKVFTPIYGKWPLGKNRGEDPRGDALMDLLLSLHTDYCDWLDANPAIKKRIYVATQQTCPATAPAAEHVLSPIKYDYYPATHELAGDIDPTNSPEVRVMVWDMSMRDKDGRMLEKRPGDLLIDNGEKKVLTCIVDDRDGKDLRITTEEALSEFCYEKGDFKKGKYPFKLFQQIKLLSPTVFWEKQRPAVFQIKATDIRIRDIIGSDGPNAITPEERAELDREAEESAAYYGIVKRAPVEQAVQPADYVRDPEMDNQRDAKKSRMTVEEMEFERNLQYAEDEF